MRRDKWRRPSTDVDAIGRIICRSRDVVSDLIGSIGEHWTEDVDQRGGAQITVVLRAIPFERLNRLMQELSRAGGIKDVIVDATNVDGGSPFRVVNNETAVHIATTILQIDPDLCVVASSKYRIEIEATAGDNKSSRARGELRRWVISAAVAAGSALVLVLLIQRRSHRH